MLSRTEMSFCSASTSNHFNIIKNNKSKRIVFPTLLWGLMIACFLVLVQPFCSFAEDTALFGDGRLTLYANHEFKSQSLSCIIETGEGGLIVIDGGWNINSEFLLKQIQAKGGHVQAWLLTHPDSDHVGAITSILNHHRQDITIDGIYCSFLDDDWYEQYCDQGCQQTVYALKDALSRMPEDVVHDDIEDRSLKLVLQPFRS
jgi:glyoxylase-like metal-dependent hydrolase (beta-lactamase superfamily II)